MTTIFFYNENFLNYNLCMHTYIQTRSKDGFVCLQLTFLLPWCSSHSFSSVAISKQDISSAWGVEEEEGNEEIAWVWHTSLNTPTRA